MMVSISRSRRIRQNLVRWLGLLTLGAMMVATGSTPSIADSADFPDAPDDTFIDIRAVHVSYMDQVYVRVRHAGRLGAGQSYSFWLDVRARHAGPEYFISFSPSSEYGELRRINTGFTDPTRPMVNCPQRRARAVVGSRAAVELWIPGACIGSPSRVRISTRFRQETNIFWDDWAPGFRRFSVWVDRY